MPGHFEFDFKHKILLVISEGAITDADVQTVKRAVAEHANRLHPAAVIADLSLVSKFDVSAEVLRSAARQPSPHVDAIPSFIVAPQEYLFGMARMYEQVGSGKRPNLKAFHTRHEALAALGIADPEFEPVV
jgi:hypothetical protein